MAIKTAPYVCAKCQYTNCDMDEFRATGGNFPEILDVQNKKFTPLSCKQCGHTEI